ncbi:MAG TPA: hypothetical protein VFI70_09800 [Nitrososphaeraceae archaeon]|nr:hypothetical protein [Nitrososphaeraceae archaeon]
MSQRCKWLHENIENLPSIRYPFTLQKLPHNGIYFFYEEGENSNHSDKLWEEEGATDNFKPRIVRIGTHRENNFRSRIAEHFLLDESKMNFTIANSKPSDRSIFRKNIGRALLHRKNDYYQKMWEIDFTSKHNRIDRGIMRNIEKEKQVESEITKLLRDNFYFRYISFEGQARRIGTLGIESKLIGTVASCKWCRPSNKWLGKDSPIPEIASGKLWLSQHLTASGLTEQDKSEIENAIIKTREFLGSSR